MNKICSFVCDSYSISVGQGWSGGGRPGEHPSSGCTSSLSSADTLKLGRPKGSHQKQVVLEWNLLTTESRACGLKGVCSFFCFLWGCPQPYHNLVVYEADFQECFGPLRSYLSDTKLTDMSLWKVTTVCVL